MKSTSLKLKIRTTDDFFNEAKSSLKSKKRIVDKKDEVYFDSIESLRSFVTPQKIEILSVIANLDPESIYRIAKTVNRNISSVQKDCSALEEAGFIVIEPDDVGAKRRMLPKLSFNYLSIEINSPFSPYVVHISKKAS